MPRKLRAAKRRVTTAADVSPVVACYMLHRDFAKARQLAAELRDFGGLASLYMDWRQYPATWAAIEDEALVRWVAECPGTRPESWWYYSAPELRRVLDPHVTTPGAGRCRGTGLPYLVAPSGPPPRVESTPMYLDRLGLWLEGERARLPASAFEPQRYALWDNPRLEADRWAQR